MDRAEVPPLSRRSMLAGSAAAAVVIVTGLPAGLAGGSRDVLPERQARDHARSTPMRAHVFASDPRAGLAGYGILPG